MMKRATESYMRFRRQYDFVCRLIVATVLLTLAIGAQRASAQVASTHMRPDDVASSSVRNIQRMDDHWLLQRMPGFKDWKSTAVLNPARIAQLHCPWPAGDWTPVQLPDDYIIAGKFSRKNNALHGFLPVYPAWYRRTFSVPTSARGKSIWLNFGGVYRDSVVFINGKLVGQHPSGYTDFRYNIGKFLHYHRPNILAVFVDPRWFEGWWYEGGGIYRHVRLIITDKLHVTPWGTFVISKVPGTINYGSPDGDHAAADLTIQTTVANAHRSAREFTLISRIIGPDGKAVAMISSPEHLPAGQKATFRQHAAIRNAALWSLGHCNLYHLETSLQVGRKMVDDKQTTFGIRTLRFDPARGFFLNGRRVEIKGTCNHQDFPGIGNGVPDNLWYWRIAQLKAMGSNACRCTHNSMSAAFYRACNHLGMLVMDENRHLGDAWTPKSYHGTGYSNLTDLRDMVLQHRNDPCIIFWSMCNEEWPLQGKPEGAKIFAAMKKVVDQLDPTRPVSSAMNGGYNKQGFFSVEDLLGINYHCGHYPGIHRTFPTKMIFGSEDFNCFSERGVLKTSRQAGLCSEFGARFPRTNQWLYDHKPWISWIPVVEHSYVAGDFIWTGFDYRGEPNPFGWPDVASQTGAMDQCGFPKPCYYYWRAWWGTTPSVYIFPAWTFPKSMVGHPIRIRCYCNCSHVELFLNGKSLGIKPMPKYKYIDWNVPYTPGTLTARGYNGGRVAATYTCRTAGPAAALQLSDEISTLAADGESVAPIAVTVVDARGNPVPNADNLVSATISGDGLIVGMGNGDPACHESNTAHQIHAFNGKCMVMVRAGRTVGTIHLTVAAKGLKTEVMSIVVNH